MNISKITIQITQELVNDFAKLTGDYNSLHMNPAEARVYSYRHRIVHGMLPVSLLFMCPIFSQTKGAIKKITGRFLSPIFIGDTLTLEVLKTDQLENIQRFSYKICSSSHANVATFGEVFINLSEVSISSSRTVGAKEAGTLLLEQLKENNLDSQDMIKGKSEYVRFMAVQESLAFWQSQLKKCAKSQDGLVETVIFDQAALVLCSTLVGMRLPGRLATFLDFSLEFKESLKGEVPYELGGTIDYFSPINRIAVVKIQVGEPRRMEEKMITGKVSIKLNELSKVLPDFKTIRDASGLMLKNKVVIVTGASRGIGATTARLFAAHGAKVVVNYFMRAEDAQKVVDDIVSQGECAIAVKADVTSRKEVEAMVARVVAELGEVDILVNNAVGDFISVPFQSLTWEKVQQDMDVIVQGAFHCCQAVIPSMIKNKGGRIINMASIATETPVPGQCKYVMAKSALVGLTRSLAVELAGHNILVNMVMPSLVETDLTKSVPQAVRETMAQAAPLGRHPDTIEVAKAIVALASSYSSYTTGQKFLVTGGLSPLL